MRATKKAFYFFVLLCTASLYTLHSHAEPTTVKRQSTAIKKKIEKNKFPLWKKIAPCFGTPALYASWLLIDYFAEELTRSTIKPNSISETILKWLFFFLLLFAIVLCTSYIYYFFIEKNEKIIDDFYSNDFFITSILAQVMMHIVAYYITEDRNFLKRLIVIILSFLIIPVTIYYLCFLKEKKEEWDIEKVKL